MADRMSQALNAARAWVSTHPDQFGGVEPANVVAHLGVVNRPLWENLKAAYEAEVGNTGRGVTGKGGETVNEWGFRNPQIGQELSTALPNQAPPAPPAPPPAAPVPDNSGANQAQGAADEQALAKRLDEIFGAVQSQGEQNIESEFIPARQKAIAEEAALGRLTSPVSIAPLARLDQSKQLALGNLYGNIAGQKASGEVDVSKTIQAILQSKADAARQASQFSQDLDLRKQVLGEQANEFNQKLDLDRLLGLSQVEASKSNAQTAKSRDFLDYLLAGTQAYNNTTASTKSGRSF